MSSDTNDRPPADRNVSAMIEAALEPLAGELEAEGRQPIIILGAILDADGTFDLHGAANQNYPEAPERFELLLAVLDLVIAGAPGTNLTAKAIGLGKQLADAIELAIVALEAAGAGDPGRLLDRDQADRALEILRASPIGEREILGAGGDPSGLADQSPSGSAPPAIGDVDSSS